MSMNWREGSIADVQLEELKRFTDDRGWLSELFRRDELDESDYPAMGYVSETLPGVVRGPHEHMDQSDRFAFLHGTYEVFLWDARETSSTYGVRCRLVLGSEHQATIVIPPGVVHAYRNAGDSPAMVFNFPDALYAGHGKTEPVDEIRHEDDPDSPFQLW